MRDFSSLQKAFLLTVNFCGIYPRQLDCFVSIFAGTFFLLLFDKAAFQICRYHPRLCWCLMVGISSFIYHEFIAASLNTNYIYEHYFMVVFLLIFVKPKRVFQEYSTARLGLFIKFSKGKCILCHVVVGCFDKICFDKIFLVLDLS